MSAPPNTDLRPGELAGSGVPLEQILDGVSDAVITVCSDWTMRWANANGARLLGIERGEVAGRNIAHFPGVFADGLRTACVDALSGGNPTVLEQHLDKPASWFQIRIVPLNGSLVLYFHDLIDRKRVERALRRREEDLRRITDNIPAIVSYLDRDCRLLNLNRRYEEIFGKTAEWAIGRHLSEVAGEPHYSIARPWLDRALAGEQVQFESRIRGRDGDLRDISVTYTPQTEAGEVSGVIAMVQDITERKRASAALHESEVRLRLAASAARIGTWDRDLLDKRLTLSSQARLHLGFLPHESPSFEQWMDRVHEEDRDAVAEAVNGASANPETFEREFRIHHPDGSLCWILCHGRVITSADGKPLRTIGVLRDVTERKQAEEKLREAADRLSFALEAAQMGDWHWDAQTDLVTLSDSGCDMFGLSRDCRITWTEMQSLIHPEEREIARREVDRAGREHNDYRCEYRVRRPEGGWRWIFASGRATYDCSGNLRSMAGVIQDTTGRREAEEALRQSNEELRRANDDLQQFAFSASHDLREPLRMITTYSQLLQRRYQKALDGDANRFIEYTVQGSERMEALIRDLLAYTQVTTLAQHAADKLIDANVVLKDVLETFRIRMEETGARVISDSLPHVAMHEVHLQQMLQNLIGNALKYRGEQPPLIRIGVKHTGREWLISVADNGLGIEPEYLSRIFGIFRRLHRADQYPGTGIGLAICQKIAHRYGGRIWAESAGVGHGTTFRFTLAADVACFPGESVAAETTA